MTCYKRWENCLHILSSFPSHNDMQLLQQIVNTHSQLCGSIFGSVFPVSQNMDLHSTKNFSSVFLPRHPWNRYYL